MPPVPVDDVVLYAGACEGPGTELEYMILQASAQGDVEWLQELLSKGVPVMSISKVRKTCTCKLHRFIMTRLHNDTMHTHEQLTYTTAAGWQDTTDDC
jgi:hypothetical protein